MKETIKNNIFGGKITSSLGAVVAIFSLLGLSGDAATAEAVHQFLATNADTIAQIVAVAALLFARDPQVLVKPKNNAQVTAEGVVSISTKELLKLVKEQNENPQEGEE